LLVELGSIARDASVQVVVFGGCRCSLLRRTLAQAHEHASQVMVANLQARDAQKGIAAFNDKRPAAWCLGADDLVASDE
jgi:hypothetical protein